MRDTKIVAGAVLALLLIQGLAQHAWAQEPQKLLLEGDMALWAVAVKPDTTAQFEQVLAKLRTALQTSDNPERRLQGKNWRVIRMATPLPDGNVGYVHMVSSPVPGADYTVMRILYEAFPDQARAIYDLYMGSFAANVSLATGTVVADMSTAP